MNNLLLTTVETSTINDIKVNWYKQGNILSIETYKNYKAVIFGRDSNFDNWIATGIFLNNELTEVVDAEKF